MGDSGVGEEAGGAVEVAEGIGEATASGVAVAATAAGMVLVAGEVGVPSPAGVEGGRVATAAGVAADGDDAPQAANESNAATNATKPASRRIPTIADRCSLGGIRAIG